MSCCLFSKSFYNCIKLLGPYYPCHLHANHCIIIKMIIKNPCHLILPHGYHKDEIQAIK
jgi:hypothetical protein